MKILETRNYPETLKNITGTPRSLTYKGLLPKEGAKFLCIIGSRKSTEYGRRVCKELVSGLKGYPISIVSGLALGIDGVAHAAALDANLHTIAFPGSGLNESVLYPKLHLPLAKEIIAKGGCLMSEYKPHQHAHPSFSPQRNKLMAGISHAVLVIEAEKRSGTTITARLALEYNREVLVTPGPIFSDTYNGIHELLVQGATPVSSSEEILKILGLIC